MIINALKMPRPPANSRERKNLLHELHKLLCGPFRFHIVPIDLSILIFHILNKMVLSTLEYEPGLFDAMRFVIVIF